MKFACILALPAVASGLVGHFAETDVFADDNTCSGTPDIGKVWYALDTCVTSGSESVRSQCSGRTLTMQLFTDTACSVAASPATLTINASNCTQVGGGTYANTVSCGEMTCTGTGANGQYVASNGESCTANTPAAPTPAAPSPAAPVGGGLAQGFPTGGGVANGFVVTVAAFKLWNDSSCTVPFTEGEDQGRMQNYMYIKTGSCNMLGNSIWTCQGSDSVSVDYFEDEDRRCQTPDSTNPRTVMSATTCANATMGARFESLHFCGKMMCSGSADNPIAMMSSECTHITTTTTTVSVSATTTVGGDDNETTSDSASLRAWAASAAVIAGAMLA